MLVNFSIENFGPVKERQTISFEADKSTHLEDYYVIQAPGNLRLLKMILLYGANASGKSTILKALDFLRNLVLKPHDIKTATLDFHPYLFDKFTPLNNSSFIIDFIQNGNRYRYEVEFNRSAIVREELFYVLRNKNIFRRVTNLEKQITEITFGSSVKQSKKIKTILEVNTLWNHTVLGGFLKTNIELPELKDVTDWFKEYLTPIVTPGTDLQLFITNQIWNSKINKSIVLDILSRADLNVTDLSIQEKKEIPQPKFLEYLDKILEVPKQEIEELKSTGLRTYEPVLVHTLENISYSLPFELESEGTKRFYGFAGLLAMLKNGPVCLTIDEVEASLHPELFIHFLLAFLVNVSGSQLILTTHNREIMGNKDILRNDTIWFTDKSEDGSTKVYSVNDFESSVVRDTTNLLNAYKLGKLGGTPNLGDYFF